MALRAVTVLESPDPLELPDVRRLEQMPCWPGWVASRIGSIRKEVQPDPTTGKWREVPTVPSDLMLKAAEREELSRHVSELDALCERMPSSERKFEQETLLAVTKMMLVLPSTTQNELSAEARGEAYMAALDDIPSWAVQAAIRQWYRGSCGTNQQGKPYDYHWCPMPAELRRIAWSEMHRLKARANEIHKLLGAERLIEFSDEHCRQMRIRFAELLGSGNPPVGKDGSGGATGKQPVDGAHCGTQPEAHTRPEA